MNAGGYGVFNLAGRRYMAHRFAYELLRAPIPDGLVLDHLCHSQDAACPGGDACNHRGCVNPDHLEPVTQHVNSLRGVPANRTHCPKGHEYTPENTFVRPDGRGRPGRHCRTCHNERLKEYAQRNYACPICGKELRRKYRSEHMWRMHDDAA